MALVHHADDDDAYDVGYEEGKLLLPSNVLSEAFGTKLCLENDNRPQKKKQQGQRRSNGGGRRWSTHKRNNKFASKPGPRAPAGPISPYQNPRYVNGGPGTQVFFLNSFRATSGTGVFIPERPYTSSKSTKKSAYIPIFIPTQFAQAMNFGVPAMGIPPTQVPEFYPNWGEVSNYDDSVAVEYEDEEETDDDALKKCSDLDDGAIVSAESQVSSYPEINLPEDWTY